MRYLLSSELAHRPERAFLTEERAWTLPRLPEWHSARSFEGGERDSLDALAYTAFAQRLKPDVIHVAHVFEGLGDRVPLPDPTCRVPGQIFSATLYDLIPLVFPQHYFSLPGLKPWYLARMQWLRQADLLLAISEATRRDAIERLGIDPWRVVTVHGGIGDHFAPPVDRAATLATLRGRYPLQDRFVLYTGGDDHRKNLEGAIEAFAAVAPARRDGVQLVVVCDLPDERREHFLAVGRRAGLSPGQLLITGFVAEEDLVALYGTCELFVFPSLYEGLGLPVLEAMACGAPAIGGDNSSVREIIARSDALFDARSATAIAGCIDRVLGDPALARDLRQHGLRRAADFTWARTAQRAAEALDDALARARQQGASSAVHGWVPRKRLAMHTPLPPARSGIADYNAAFLPYLARHFEIDVYVDGRAADDAEVNASYRIFDARDFPAVANAYDAILYEFGNSEYHTSMVELLERFPGVVGLHDAYLSGLSRYRAAVRGVPGEYHRDLLASHGSRARRVLAPIQAIDDADEVAMVTFPCTRAVLDRALGVISHSPFNLDVAREHYPEGWAAPYRIVPQMVPAAPALDATTRTQLREAHGFGADDFVVATFGHVAWTKCGDRLLAAFLQSRLSPDAHVHLVFAGELSGDDFGAELARAVDASMLGSRVRITGYLAASDYDAFLACADLAVQLRTRSRGGTPKGVLDCLARGVPVIVNDDASYRDYPDDVVIKLPADPDAASIAAALERARDDTDWLAAHATAGVRYVERHHAPAGCAAGYAAAIEEFYARHRVAQASAWPRGFAAHLAGPAAADWLAQLPVPVFGNRRVYIDVSHIVEEDHQTGVPRVVRQIVRRLMCSDRAGVEVMAVALRDGALHVPAGWLRAEGLLVEGEAEWMSGPIEFRAGDVLLMLDSSWARYAEFHPVFEAVHAVGGKVVTAVYDLLPIRLPPGNIVEGGRAWFEGWVRDAIAQSDALVCISRTVADDVVEYIRDNRLGRAGLRVGYWHLGGDFASREGHGERSARVRSATRAPFLLMLGTIEPRKCHSLALDAVERLWSTGAGPGLVVAGKEGWMVGDFMDRVRGHPQLGQRLFLVERPDDAEIAALYDDAAALLFLSKGEGFGLPLVEAASHGTSIVCSDLPVFREVADGYATFVTAADATGLAAELEAWWGRKQLGDLPDTRAMPRLTWEQSGDALLDVLLGNRWHWRQG